MIGRFNKMAENNEKESNETKGGITTLTSITGSPKTPPEDQKQPKKRGKYGSFLYKKRIFKKNLMG